jgi:YihY family inner membrane protein
VSSVARVPEAAGSGGPVGVADAWAGLRSIGPLALIRAAASRFRYGDGFSSARALAFQTALAVVPSVIATVGLASAWEAATIRAILRRTVLQLTPGASDPLLRRTLPEADTDLGAVPLVLAAGSAVVALTTAMAQVERGANRIYGIQRDRPFAGKYRRALGLSVAAGLPLMAGTLLLLTGRAFAAAVESVQLLDDDVVEAVTTPVGLALLVVALTSLLHAGPARRQPTWPVLLVGGLLAVGAWAALTLLLAGFLALSTDLGSVYGPLTGFIALLLWAQLSAVALFLGVAVTAELEWAAHHGPGRPGAPPVAPAPVRRQGRSPAAHLCDGSVAMPPHGA